MPRYTFRDARLFVSDTPAPYVPSPHVGARIEPSVIVLHYTADRLDPNDSVRWFADPASRVSAHFVVGRDGSITQCVPIDRAAWHAGVSSWQGRPNVNGYSIGIELDNPGRLSGTAKCARAWFGQSFSVERDALVEADGGWWLPYTPEQLTAACDLVRALAAACPSVTDVVGHNDIAPGRKEDPGPMLPWVEVKRALGRRIAPDADAIRDVQQRLAALHYWPGAIDGVMGARTRSAVRDFQEQHGLATTGALDEATMGTLMSAAARPMPTATREATTPADLRAAGSTTAWTAYVQKRAAEIATAAVVVKTARDAVTGAVPGAVTDAPQVNSDVPVLNSSSTEAVLETARTALDQATAVGALVRQARDAVASLTVADLAMLAAIVGVGALIWVCAHRVETARVAATRSGRMRS